MHQRAEDHPEGGDPGDVGALELDLLLRLGQAKFDVFRGGAPEAIATFDRADRRADVVARVIARYGRYVGLMLNGWLPEAEAAGRQVVAIASVTGRA